MFLPGVNLIEGRVMVYSEKIFVADSNEIAVSYCIG
jgi:hypothetical protein